MTKATHHTFAKIAAIVAGLGLVAMLVGFGTNAKADAFAFGQKSFITPGATTDINAGAKEATTTVAYLETGDTATSSVIAFVGDAGSIHLDLLLNASTTNTILNEYRYFSDNGIDWYAEDLTTVTSNILVAHSSTTPVRTWAPGAAGTRLKHQVIDTNSKYVKIDFGVSTANASLHAIAVPKQETPN